MSTGQTRIVGKAGASIDLKHYLAADIRERMEKLTIAVPGWTYGSDSMDVDVVAFGLD